MPVGSTEAADVDGARHAAGVAMLEDAERQRGGKGARGGCGFAGSMGKENEEGT